MRLQLDIRQVSRTATRQHGNVTASQLRDADLSKTDVRRLADRGWLIRRHRGVYAVGHVPASRHSRWMAAVLAFGEDAVLSHRAGGAHWEVLRGAVPTEVTIPRGSGCSGRDGVLLHRMPLPESHVTVRDGIPVTTLIRTVLDLATVLPLRRLESAFEQAQVIHELPPEPLGAEVLCRRGYRGNAKLRTVLAGAVDPAGVRSILELRFLRMCEAHGIPRPLVNEPMGRWTPDFLWPQFGLVVETDGHAFHRTAAARRRDALKDEALRAMDLVVVRITWAEVTEKPVATAAELALHMPSVELAVT